VRTDFIRVTEDTVLTPITIQVENHDVEFQNKGGVMHAVLDMFARSLAWPGESWALLRKAWRSTFPESEFQRYVTKRSIYQKALPLRPGRYKVTVVVKDDINGHVGSMELGILVPHYRTTALLQFLDPGRPDPAPATSQVGSGRS